MDRFHSLLAAEQDYPEAAAVHGLFVLTYYAQHLSLCKPWLRAAQRETMCQVFGEGRDCWEVLAWPRNRARRQGSVDQAKAVHAADLGAPAVGACSAGEVTVADLPVPGQRQYPSEYVARSVAAHSFL